MEKAKPQIDKAKEKSFFAKYKPIFNYKVEGAIIWLVYFIVSEILISGGRYERDTYTYVAAIIFVLTTIITILVRKKTTDIKDAITRGVIWLVVVVVLDYLIVNWLLQGNQLVIFKSWGPLTVYGLTLVSPLAQVVINRYRKTRRESNLLTNPSPTL